MNFIDIGRGSRLNKLTKKTKCLTVIKNKKTLLDYISQILIKMIIKLFHRI